MRSRPGAGLALAAATLVMFAAAPRPSKAVTYTVAFAGMHNHTGYSDGVPETTPATAYAAAKANGLDIMTVTEHSESFDVPMTFSEQCLDERIARCALADPDTPDNSFRKWDATLEQAQAATGADFLAVRGFEWTSDVYDHVNVYLSGAYTNAKIDGGYATMATFWRWFLAHHDALATFNHPGDKTNENIDKAGIEIAPGPYDDFRYVPDADYRTVGIEVFNGGKSKDYTNRGGVNWIARSLNSGWHVGLVGAQDTHTDDWGDPAKYARTGFLMPALSKENFREALLARRFYATTDANLELAFTADTEPMGSRLRRPAGAPVSIEVSATDPDAEQISRIELFTNGLTRDAMTKVAESTTASLHATVTSAVGERWYLARVTQADGEKAYTSPIWIGARTHPYGEWVSGDLHVHTQNGHDTCMASDPTMRFDGTECELEERYTWSFSPGERIALAEERGLDFLAVTDHNNIVSQTDPEYLAEVAAEQSGTSLFTLIPAYENSLPGHVQMLGAAKCYGGQHTETLKPIPITYCDNPSADPEKPNMPSDVLNEIDALLADGGLFQINHPGDRKWVGRYDKDSNANGITDLFEMIPDSIEVWNIGGWEYQPPAPAANDNDFSLSLWERFLNAGYHVAATGGSDSHWRSTSAVQGIGQPTTWVYSTGRSWSDVLGGIRAGATLVSHQPPAYAGQRVFLEADADGPAGGVYSTYESMPGDVVPVGSSMRVRVEGAAPGAIVRVFAEGEAPRDLPVASDGVSQTFMSAGRWVRAELLVPDAQAQRTSGCDPFLGSRTTYCRNRFLVLSLTSAIYQL